MNGRLLVLEGLNGCGKSSTAAELNKIMTAKGYKVATFKDPGDTAVGERVRQIVKDPAIHMDALTQTLLYSAARRELIQKIVPLVIHDGYWVILDRWWPSTYVYQGALGVSEDVIFDLDKEVTGDVRLCTYKEFTFFLDVPVEVAMDRSGALRPAGTESGGDRFEMMGLVFQRQARHRYRALVSRGYMTRIRADVFSSPKATANHIWTYHVEAEAQGII